MNKDLEILSERTGMSIEEIQNAIIEAVNKVKEIFVGLYKKLKKFLRKVVISISKYKLYKVYRYKKYLRTITNRRKLYVKRKRLGLE